MSTITKEYHIMAPLEKVWQALVDPQVIAKWGAGPAKMKAQAGFKFSLWGGDIHGKNLEIIPHQKLVQDWYGGNWPRPSQATFTLTHKAGCTTLKLSHTDVPEKEVQAIDHGWDDYYLGPLKKLLK